MDCFFASVAVLTRPELKDVPFVVCHSSNKNGTAEISCANYPARKLGIHAGMFISSAMEICPSLEVVPYHFQQYHEISEKAYEIMMQHSSCIEPVSCDEAFLDVTGLGDGEEIAKAIRTKIQEATRCTASAGIGPNKLMAKIATTKAKPNGQGRIRSADALGILAEMLIGELPGVGWSLHGRLQKMGVEQVYQLQSMSKDSLVQEFGEKTGTTLWDSAHGIDSSPVQLPKVRKSVSAECNWGIRLKDASDVKCYLQEILHQVLHRMSFLDLKGRCITLKIRTRREDAPVVPRKFLGCGSCDSISRSHTLDCFTDRSEVFMEHLWSLFVQTETPIHEIRGLGITVSKLNNEKGQSMTLLALVQSKPPGSIQNRDAVPVEIKPQKKRRKAQDAAPSIKRPTIKLRRCVRMVQPDGLVLSDVDPEVLAALPEDLRKEIVQTIPLERDNLFVTGNDRLPKKRPKPASPPAGDMTLEELLCGGHSPRIPDLVDSSLRENLVHGDDVVIWAEASECTDGNNSETVLDVLHKVRTWMVSVNEIHMETVSQVLKVVRRLGHEFPNAFGPCSSQFIEDFQNDLRHRSGYELDLGSFLGPQ